ncbi:MAG: hypothetical protein AB7V39_16225 [Nitrospiraceae bacterium]
MPIVKRIAEADLKAEIALDKAAIAAAVEAEGPAQEGPSAEFQGLISSAKALRNPYTRDSVDIINAVIMSPLIANLALTVPEEKRGELIEKYYDLAMRLIRK